MVCVYSSLSIFFFACGTVLAAASEPDASLDDVALPDVDAMMSEASETVSSLAKEADKMEEAMASTHLRHQAHLDKLRASYTSRLAAKDKAIEEIAAQNTYMKHQTESLDAGNERTSVSAKALQETNRGLRSMFTALTPKFLAAKVFLRAALNASEAPLHSKEIQVLHSQSPPPSLENFLQVLKADGGHDQRHSLMQIGGRSTVRRAGVIATLKSRAHAAAEDTAANIVKELTQQMKDIGQAHEEGDLQMKANFIANFEARQIKAGKLLAEQRKLNETKTNALLRQRNLFAANTALQRVNEDLVTRLKGLSTFALGSSEYVVKRLAMASNATGDMDAKPASVEMLQSAKSARSMFGDVAWL